MNNGDIAVRNPKRLGVTAIPAERIPLGAPGDYKPCIAKLPSGELWIVAFHQYSVSAPRIFGEPRVREPMVLFRSQDGGKTWSDGETLDLLGREPYFSITRDGIIFITASMYFADIRAPVSYQIGYLHRSVDMGRTWQTIALTTEEVEAAPPRPKWILHSRNVLETADGTLIYGVDLMHVGQYLWRSRDGGATWDRSLECSFQGTDQVTNAWGNAWWNSGIAEAVFWQARNRDLLGIFRVESYCFPPIPGAELVDQINDQYQRLVVFRSSDGGRCWTFENELGSYYGEMYPAVLRLHDGRILLTFTVRAARTPLGVHAVLGRETDTGFDFDFEHDRLILDDNTPVGVESGGGFGPTVQMDDGTLVTAYSWRDSDQQTHIETVRWELPRN